MKEVELKKWKETKLKKKKRPREEDYYLKSTEHGKTTYTAKVTKEEVEKGCLRVPDEIVEELMKGLNVKSWHELEFIPHKKGKNEIAFEVRKRATYVA